MVAFAVGMTSLTGFWESQEWFCDREGNVLTRNLSLVYLRANMRRRRLGRTSRVRASWASSRAGEPSKTVTRNWATVSPDGRRKQTIGLEHTRTCL